MSGTRVRAACGLTGAVLAAIIALVTAGGAQAALARVGTRAAIPTGAIVHGPLASATRLHVDVTLKPRNPAALAAYATAVSTLGSADYRRYLTPAQFARRFGATPAQVDQVLAALRAGGLHPGAVSAGSLSIPVVGTAAQLEHAFSISLSQVSLPGRRTGIVADERPAFARAAASDVQTVVGLDTTSAPRPLLVRPPASGRGKWSGLTKLLWAEILSDRRHSKGITRLPKESTFSIRATRTASSTSQSTFRTPPGVNERRRGRRVFRRAVTFLFMDCRTDTSGWERHIGQRIGQTGVSPSPIRRSTRSGWRCRTELRLRSVLERRSLTTSCVRP